MWFSPQDKVTVLIAHTAKVEKIALFALTVFS